VVERSPQALDEDVVHPAIATVRRDADAGGGQRAGEGGAGELASLIEDLGSAEPGQCLLQRRDAERDVDGVRQPPCQHRPARPIHRRHEVEKAARQSAPSIIGLPRHDLVRTGDEAARQSPLSRGRAIQVRHGRNRGPYNRPTTRRMRR